MCARASSGCIYRATFFLGQSLDLASCSAVAVKAPKCGRAKTSTAAETKRNTISLAWAFKTGMLVKANMSGRRTFLIQGDLVLGGISAGTFTPLETAMNVRGRREFLKAVSPATGTA